MSKVRTERRTIHNQPDLFPKKSRANFYAPDITESGLKQVIGEVDEKFANVEAERGESVLTNAGEFFYISGKKHSQGGTPLSLNKGDFIFSDKLKVHGKEIKEIHPWAKENKKYSYSDIARKYGTKVNYFKELEQSDDDLEQTTAQLMQQNIGKKLSEVALLQEAKKGFPQGTPQVGDKTFAQLGAFVPANNFESAFDYKPSEQYYKPVGETDSNEFKLPPIGDPKVGSTSKTNSGIRFSLPDTLAVANSIYNLATIPKVNPSRSENYGIAQAMGILQNQKPLDYQSQINEVNKSLSQASQSIQASATNPQQQAALLSNFYGQSLEATSRIRGAEYNANTQLENQTAARLAEYTVARGADVANNARLYNESVDNLKQNFYEDSVRARNNALQTTLAAYNNALAINTENQLNPNYQIDPYRLNLRFKAPGYNPLTEGPGQGRYFSPVSTIQSFANQIGEVTDDREDFRRFQEARRVIRNLPKEYQQLIFQGQY